MKLYVAYAKKGCESDTDSIFFYDVKHKVCHVMFNKDHDADVWIPDESSQIQRCNLTDWRSYWRVVPIKKFKLSIVE